MTIYIYVPLADPYCQKMRHDMCRADRANIRYIANPTDLGTLEFGINSAHWNDVGDTDTLFIIGHGSKSGTNNITWKGDGTAAPVSWSYRELARRLQGWLGATATTPRNTTIELAMCFSANNITPLNKSFGAKLKSVMPAHHLTGSVIAYQGIVNTDINGLDAHGEVAFQCEGTSRFSAGLSRLSHKLTKKDKSLHERQSNKRTF